MEDWLFDLMNLKKVGYKILVNNQELERQLG
jgi:hypothetical protein